jgi:mannonate dehydratase
MEPMDFIREVGRHIPGWEADLLGPKLLHLMKQFKDIDEEALWGNLKYFLDAILPVAESAGVKMAIHPDDPPWPVFGLPRIITGMDSYHRLFALNPSSANGATICSGSLGANRDNNVPAIIRYVGGQGRLFYGHVRNVRHLSGKSFEETAHLSSSGSLDLYEIMLAFRDVNFQGPIRPDHGRMIWGEKQIPGYGLYDRAIGISYIQGIWEAIEKNERKGVARGL